MGFIDGNSVGLGNVDFEVGTLLKVGIVDIEGEVEGLLVGSKVPRW